MDANQFLGSNNLVARLNMLNMRYPPEDKLRIYHAAQEGLITLEPDPRMQLKYADFIEIYCPLSDEEQRRYRNEFLANSPYGEAIMGFTSTIRDEGRQEGRQEGHQETQIHTLLRLLEKRFGPQPAILQERLANASAEQLDTWILRVLDTASVDEVFGSRPESH